MQAQKVGDLKVAVSEVPVRLPAIPVPVQPVAFPTAEPGLGPDCHATEVARGSVKAPITNQVNAIPQRLLRSGCGGGW